MFKQLTGLFLALTWMTTAASAADPACEHFKTKAPILDVLKDPRKVGDYVGELQRGDVVCIKKKRKIGRRTWGLVDHVVLEDGKLDKLNGWVGLRFMTPHKLARAATAPKKVLPSKPIIRSTSPPPSSYTPDKKGKSKAELDREAEIAYWNTVRESDDPELIVSYLGQYPNGTFSKLARLMLDKLERKEDRAGTRRNDDSKPDARPRRTEPKSRAQSRKRRNREAEEKRYRRSERRRAERQRAERRGRDRARRAERQRAQQARNRRRARAERDRPRRQRRPRCRMETRFECIKRGGTINSSGDCNVDRICR